MQKYYHNLEQRRQETVHTLKRDKQVPLRRLSLHLISACSLKCTYCYTRKEEDNLVKPKPSKETDPFFNSHFELTPLLFNRIDEAADIGLQQIHIIGGEPTLLDNLPDLIRHASGYQINTSLVTNGASFNTQSESYQEKLIYNGLGALTVSLDTYDKAINDRAVRVRGAHQLTVDFVKAMIEKRNRIGVKNDQFPIYINTVVDNDNIFKLHDHLSFLHELGVTDVKLLMIKKMEKRRLDQKTYEKFREETLFQLLELSDKYHFGMFKDDLRTLLGDKGSMMKRVIHGEYYMPNYSPCYLSLSELCIVSNGDIYTCIYHYWDNKPNIGMNILTHTIRKIWEAYRPLDHNDPSVCNSNCTREVIDINKKMYSDLTSPRYRKTDIINSIERGTKFQLTRLEIALSNKCTLKCDYCTEITLKQASIRKDRVLNIIDQAHKLGAESISLTGGEPTAVEYLPELVDFIKNKGMLCKITTNGYGKNLNDDYIRQLLNAGLDRMTVSYYSTDSKLYFRITKRKDAQKQVENYIHSLQNLKSEGYYFFWNMNLIIDNLNYSELPQRLLFLDKFAGINQIVPIVIKRKTNRFFNKKEIQHYYQNVLPDIESLHLENRFPLMYRECRKLFGLNEEDKSLTSQGFYWAVNAERCYHNYNNMFIANDGNVYHCFAFHIHRGQSLGNIYDTSLDQIWETHQKFMATLNPSEHPTCQIHRCNPDITAFNNQIHHERHHNE